MEQSVAKEVFEMRTPEEIKKGLEICIADENCRDCPYKNGYCDMQLERDALSYIQQLEAQQPRWISVGERLPEDDGYVLCHCNDGSPDVVCMYYGDGEFLTPELDNVSHIITHWMPLPQPPEEERK